MTQHRGLFVALDAGNLGTLPIDARLALSGLVVTDGGSAIAARPGVFYDGKGSAVTGTAATGTMTYSVRSLVAAFYLLGVASSGMVIACNDGAITVNTTAAPGANSRIDVIWVRQTAVASDGGADATNTFIVGVTQGTAAASPTVPAIPTGALALAQAVVLSTTLHTDTTVITQVHNWTCAAGGSIAVRNTTERDALTAFDGMECYRLDTHNHETYDSGVTAWLRDAAQLPQQNLSHQPRRLLTRTATFSLADATLTAIGTWSAETGDDGNSTGLSLSGTIMTCLYGGLYLVEFSMEFAAAAVGARRVEMLKNGAVGPPATGTLLDARDVAGAASGLATAAISGHYALSPGDTLEPAALQTSGSAMTCGSGTAGFVVWRVVRIDDL